jgi:hypothetical protein
MPSEVETSRSLPQQTTRSFDFARDDNAGSATAADQPGGQICRIMLTTGQQPCPPGTANVYGHAADAVQAFGRLRL